MNPAAITACPTCGEQSTESYGPRGLCWHCYDGGGTHNSASPKVADNSASPKVAAVPSPSGTNAYAVTWTDGKPPKLVLPEPPPHDDLAGLLAWTTCVLRLDPRHPATGVAHRGKRGQDGHGEIRRAGVPALRFEPASTINAARRFVPALQWQLHPTDGEPHGFKDEHCKRIAYVLRLAAGACAAPDAPQEAAGIVGTFTMSAEAVEGFTIYGTSGQRHEAVEALRNVAFAPPRYLIDDSTGEYVIRVSDLQEAARRHVGSSLAHGWLDARMEQLGWTRAQLQGYTQSERDRSKRVHNRCDVYRGHLAPSDPDDNGSVNT